MSRFFVQKKKEEKRILAFCMAVIFCLSAFVLTPTAAVAADAAIVDGMALIADFSFDGTAAGLTGAGAKANVNGTPAYGAGQNGGSAANLSSSFWLNVTKEDGSPLLAGLDEFTVSYDSNPSAASSNSGWTFFASRTVRAPKSSWERYLGVIDKSASIDVQRFYNTGARPAYALNAIPTSGWRHVDIVFSKNMTRLYIDGILKNLQSSDASIEEVLSAAGGFLYIGRSTWGSGEYYQGLIQNFKIWKPAAPDDAGKVAAAKADLSLPYGIAENQVYGNITLPKTGLYDTAITWATDSPAIVDVNEYANPGGDPRLPGTVTRPAADTVVTMTATIASGGASDTKAFRFTVKKAPEPLDDLEAYMFTHFTGTEGSITDEQIYFTVSDDAVTWTDLTQAGQPVLTSEIGDGGVRDPYLIRSPEGDTFYLIATDLSINRRGGWGSAGWQSSSTNLAVWESNDLVHWSDLRLVDVAGGIQDAGMAWAPEAVYDAVTGDYFVFWATLSTVASSAGTAATIFYARTRDFRTFTKPAQWIHKNDIIDTTVMKALDGYWYRATQTGNILIERSDALTGTWQTIGNLQSYFTGAWSYGAVEGPELFTYNPKDWQGDTPMYGLYVDRYGQGAGYMPFYTTDLSSTARPPWAAGTNINMGAMKKRHGGILAITKSEYDAVVKAFHTTGPVIPGVEYPDTFVLPEGMEQLAKLDFEGLAGSGGAVEVPDQSGNAKAVVNGAVNRSTDVPDGGGYAANISSAFWMNVVKRDGTGLLAGLDEMVISYDSKSSATADANGWTFFAAPNTTAPTYRSEKYLGVIDRTTGMTVQRFNSSNMDRPAANTGTKQNRWTHVDIVVRNGATELWIDGVRASTVASAVDMSDMLGASGGVIQLGKANWVNGEYYTGLLDNVKIYSGAPATADSLDGLSALPVLCDFNFNNLSTGTDSATVDAGANATAYIQGTATRSSDTRDGSLSSASLSNNFWLNIVKKDGTPLLTGRDTIVVSYDSKATASGNGWTFYADRDTTQNVYPNEHYLAIMDQSGGVTVQRFNNAGARPGNDLTGPSSTNWKHVDLIVHPNSSALYINGVLASTHTSSYKLTDILGVSGGVLQFGKANWLSGGEYYYGLVDNIEIYAAPPMPSQLLTDVKTEAPNTTIRTGMDEKTKQARLYISRSNSELRDLTAVPLAFTLFPGAEVIDPQEVYDLTSPVTVTVTYNGGELTEEWTVTAEIDNNPVLPGRYADPDILMYGGKYYIYPTTDGYAGWSGYQFKVFSSEDMIDWTDEGIIVDLQADAPYENAQGIAVATAPWSNGNAWAPAIAEKDGKFYFYFCGNNIASNNKAIGVAVADSPAGPYTVLPTPLLTLAQCQSEGITMGQVIDPEIFTDDDGVSYMLFGNGSAAIVQLGEDMMSWVPGTMKNYTGATSFREAIGVNKIDGLYHFTWSCNDTGDENYMVRYGISDSLYGPILHKGILLQKDNTMDIKGTGHHSILYHSERNEYYIVYHRFWTPLGQPLNGGLGNNRETCIDRLEYKDGLFQVVTPTLQGIAEPVYAGTPEPDPEDGTVYSLEVLTPGATLTATTTLVNKTGAVEAGIAIMAIYDSTGRLISADVSAAFEIAPDGSGIVTTAAVLPPDIGGVTVKVFVWDTDYVPIRPVSTL